MVALTHASVPVPPLRLSGRVVDFEGASVLVAESPSGEWFIGVGSIQNVLDGASFTDRKDIEAVRMMAEVTVNGIPQRAWVISEEAFYSLALSHPRFVRFRKSVAEIVRGLRQNGVVVSAEYRADPMVQMLQALAEQRMEQMRQADRLRAVEARAEQAVTIARQLDGRLSMLEIARRAGLELTEAQASAEGMWLTTWSRRALGDNPTLHKRLNDTRYGGVNTYTHEAAEQWIAERAPLYLR